MTTNEPAHVADLLGAQGRITALVGGGGKTTLLQALGAHLGRRAILTTTTRMAATEVGGARLLLGPSLDDLAEAADDDDPRPILVWSRIIDTSSGDSKGLGVDTSVPAKWLALVDHVLVEADGSRGHPAKAPAPHEPSLPTGPTDVVAVMGANALNRVIADQCHRPLRLAAAVQCSPYERLTPERAAVLLTSPGGARRSVPDDADFSIAITMVDETNRSLVDHLIAEISDREPGTPIHRFHTQRVGDPE